MVETAGTKLRRARTLRQLSIEDAARATKIRPRQLADLERDDYSNFANLAYAKGFLIGYAKFLHVNSQPYLEAFQDANTFGLDDYQYLSETPVGVYRAPVRQFRRRPRKRRLLAAGTTLGVLAMAVILWFFVVSYRRLGDLGKLAARQEAREHAARDGGRAANGPPAGAAQAAETATNAKPAAAPPTVETIPVSAPVSSSPAPTPVPVNDKTNATTAALAAVENATVVPVGPLTLPPVNGNEPAMPLPGDGAAARALTQQGPDLRATLAGAPANLSDRDPAANAQAKIIAVKPVVLDPAKRPGDPYHGSGPQPVSNNVVR